MTTADPRVPGVGVSWTSALDPLLQEREDLVDWIEFEPQTTWLVPKPGALERAPMALVEHLSQQPGRKLVHSVAAPVGGSSQVSDHHLDLLRQTVKELKAPWASEHLSFNASHGVCTGFFLPPRQTAAQVRIIADNIRRLQDRLGVPIAIENGVNYLRPRQDEMPDGEFLAMVLDAADCGLLLDLHNAYTNGRNGRQPLTTFLESLPLQRVWELHLAGGLLQDGFWLDAHSGPVPTDLWPLIRDLPAALPALRAVIFEVFPSFLVGQDLGIVAEELGRIRNWLTTANPGGEDRPTTNGTVPLKWKTQPAGGALPDQGEPWEAALTALVTGQEVEGPVPEAIALRTDLADEAGISLVRDLVFSFRASMVVQVLKLSTALLLRTVGPGVCRQMLEDAFQHHPPLLYALLEAQSFAAHVDQRGWAIPHLADLLQYEVAAAQTLIDGQPRVVRFSFEPMPLLRALADGRLPQDPLEPGDFEIEIQPDREGDWL